VTQKISALIIVVIASLIQDVAAQEFVTTLDHNAASNYHSDKKSALKTTANTLPFFEDFTDNSIFPNTGKWMDHSVYLNNTMGKDIFSKGVATFDALNADGGPYDSSDAGSLLYADSLTSQPFDLSIYQPADSLYISFFYQPQGNGFNPEQQDSLMFYLKKRNNIWVRVWAKEGSTYFPFTQVMIPVADTTFFHNGFQFRFVNKASANTNDDVWNVDYIRFAANRSQNDTAVNDVATTTASGNILNDYTAMPYRHFVNNKTTELNTQHSFDARNNYGTTQSLITGYFAHELTTGASLFAGNFNASSLSPYTTQSFSYPVYNINFSAAGSYDKVVFRHTYFASTGSLENKENDTLTYDQVFDNYFAYDDGSAEKSYFLKQYPTLPAKLAIEYHLNETDTLQGFAIYFGRQVPLADYKFFNVEVFSSIAYNGGTDNKIYDEQLFFPSYADTINHFWYYKFENPVVLNAGTFYLSMMQPANSGSDSLYYGLDGNRTGSNHAYYNVLNQWQSSSVSGAIMIRPLLGKSIIPTAAKEVNSVLQNVFIYPNPAKDQLFIRLESTEDIFYKIIDLNGYVLKKGVLKNGCIAINDLPEGMYFLSLSSTKKYYKTQKFIKQ